MNKTWLLVIGALLIGKSPLLADNGAAIGIGAGLFGLGLGAAIASSSRAEPNYIILQQDTNSKNDVYDLDDTTYNDENEPEPQNQPTKADTHHQIAYENDD